MSRDEVFNRLKASGQLPSPRGVAAEVLRLTQTDSCSSQEIARLIQSDPALTGRILKAANSPMTGLSRSVNSVGQAVVVLGMANVRQLVLGFSLVNEYRTGASGFDYDRFWSASLLTGIACGEMSAHLGQPTAKSEALFSDGLLANVGQLALATLYPKPYGALSAKWSSGEPLALALLSERQTFGIDRHALTLAMLNDWHMPPSSLLAIEVALASHALLPEASKHPASIEALVLRFALLLTELVHEDVAHWGPRGHQLAGLMRELGLSAGQFVELCQRAFSGWREWGLSLELPIADGRSVLEADWERLISSETASVALNSPDQSGVQPSVNTPSASRPSSITRHIKPSAAATKKSDPRVQAEPSAPRPLRVLLVDDDGALLVMIGKMLVVAGCEVTTAVDGRDALKQVLHVQPDVVMADWVMPEMDGIQLTTALRQTQFGEGLYIMILSATLSEDRITQAFEAGVDACVGKPFTSRQLLARLRAADRFVRQRRQLSSDFEEVRRFANDLAIDNRKLQQAVMTDVLTGLPNRRYALQRLEQEWAATRRRNVTLAILMVDVDHFKRVNDTHGHDIGDEVLRSVANVLRGKARLQDSIARIGGEEFMLICPDTSLGDAQKVAERLRFAVEEAPYRVAGAALPVTISIGVAASRADTQEVAEIVRTADMAVYRAKSGGRNRVAI